MATAVEWVAIKYLTPLLQLAAAAAQVITVVMVAQVVVLLPVALAVVGVEEVL